MVYHPGSNELKYKSIDNIIEDMSALVDEITSRQQILTNKITFIGVAQRSHDGNVDRLNSEIKAIAESKGCNYIIPRLHFRHVKDHVHYNKSCLEKHVTTYNSNHKRGSNQPPPR
jgi:hypothetical protein